MKLDRVLFDIQLVAMGLALCAYSVVYVQSVREWLS